MPSPEQYQKFTALAADNAKGKTTLQFELQRRSTSIATLSAAKSSRELYECERLIMFASAAVDLLFDVMAIDAQQGDKDAENHSRS